MHELSHFFISHPEQYQYLHGHHQLGLVILSVLIAIFASVIALHTTELSKTTHSKFYRQIIIATGSLSLAIGIWSMHFIGILSYELPTTIGFNYLYTALSFVLAWGASWIILLILSRKNITYFSLVLSGILAGLGIGTMHYVGMSALIVNGQIKYDFVFFSLSVVVAIVLAITSLFVRYRLQKTQLSYKKTALISGVILGAAISGMHYVGMYSFYLIGEPSDASTTGVFINTTIISLLLSTFTVSASILVAFAAGFIRYKQLFLKMNQSESKMRAIVDTAVDGIITIDCRGIVQAFNQSAERLFGWKAEEVIGKNINILMPEPNKSHHDGYLKNYLQTGKAKIIGSGREVEGLRKDGSILPMRLAVGRVETTKEPLFVGFVTDITERKLLESSLRKTAEQAKQASSVKSAFLANMSHEIRTPLNAIIGFTDILLQTPLSATQEKHLTTIHKSSRSLLSLLNDILDTTKLEKNSLKLEKINFSLKDVATQVVASLGLGANKKGLMLNLIYPDNMHEYFIGDPLRIQQILTNLVGNAIKFTEHGSVTIRFYQIQGQTHIEVQDTGIGMTPGQQEKIFDSFVQADASISRRFGGTGLGTTISRQLVELMGGSITVSSVYQKGSTFHITLTLPLGSSKDFQSQSEQSSLTVLPPLHILIADDVPQNVELLTLILQNNGHQVVSTNDGEMVCEAFKTERFDVVLMDVHMPRRDGLSAAREIRRYEQEQHLTKTPIIALTASVMEADRRAALEAGMDGFAVKPLDPPKLFEEIAYVLDIQTASSLAVAAKHKEMRQADADELINWDKGLILWGNKDNLTKAILKFLSDVEQRHPLPNTQDDNIDWDKAASSLHGIRGATGNLSIPSVAQLAGNLEERIKSQHLDHVLEDIAQLKHLIQSIKALLETESAVQKTEPVEIISEQDLQVNLEKLIQCIDHSELDDDALKVVGNYLNTKNRDTEFEEIYHALEAFDFAKAKNLLLTLQASFTVTH